MRLESWLSKNATTLSDRTALIEADKKVSHADLNRQATNYAGRLAQVGVASGDRVAVIAEPSCEYIYLIQALIGLGAQLVPLDPRLPEDEIEAHLAALKPRLTITDPKGLDEADAKASLNQKIDLDAVHCVIHTSGTGGEPKAVELTYGNHYHSALGSADRLGASQDDRWLLCLPLFHISGLAIVMRGLIYGATVVVMPRFDPVQMLRTIDKFGVTHISLVPTMLLRLMKEPNAAVLNRLKVVLLGGGPLPPNLLKQATGFGIPIAPTYGLTECASQVATLAPAQATEDQSSVGQPLKGTEVRVDGDGVILVRGPTVAPSSAGADGWLRTGDIGRIENGRLHVLGRADSVIVSGGENVMPEEVERTMAMHPDVEDVAVYGRDDPEWQQAATAKVVLREGAQADSATVEALREFCKQRLPGFKVPSRIHFVDQLPRNTQGKLNRREL